MEAMSLDERVFRAHLERGSFQSGVDRGRWRLVSIYWPYAVFTVAATARQNAPTGYAFRFELNNYPASPPTAQPWDITGNAPLPGQRWPGGRGRIPYAFNPNWKYGSCLYLPCDRHSIEGHDAWRTQYPELIWDPAGDITHYLWILYDLLHSEDYTGLLSA